MNSAQQTLHNNIDLHRLMVLCRKHIKLLVIWTILVGIIGFVAAEFVVTPKYTATTEILVNQKNADNDNGQAYNNQQADIQMINTYKDIITNQVILNRVSKQLDMAQTGKNYHMTTDQLKKAISVETQQNSQVFSLAVKTNDPAKSALIANTVANVFKSRIKGIMSVNNVTVVSRASAPDAPSFPNKKLFTLAGAVLGFILSFVYILIGELTDTSVHDDEFMTDELGLTNLGHINHISMSNDFKINQRESRREDHRRV
ncbi:YveK family protein [Limosilactobacillus reuteri]|uniref:YveK family protein n=1 Tax=Limosilactobacillus reuteri TaxID=1598 RepID=UPI00128DD50F|nr:Wzz/FepE/Etk N-terminal domain-containing protein [Limosilactobacillus reuteri]MQB59610.1 exopolysaccharide biosynthesis protein [Limosilactobacillus reuteri]MQB83039.1 exopolysaccharide biosynthesis protein [Limosilactobacillus reuteri]